MILRNEMPSGFTDEDRSNPNDDDASYWSNEGS